MELLEKIFAYNRAILAQEEKSKKLDQVQALIQSLTDRPSLGELMTLLQSLKKLVQF